MYFLTEINFIFLFIVLASSITVDFAGYFDFNRKWTYSYKLVQTSAEISRNDVRKQAGTGTAETHKEESIAKNTKEIEQTTPKTRFFVTGLFEKDTTENTETKNEQHLRQETTTFSDEDLERQVTESVIKSPSFNLAATKQILSAQINLGFEDGVTDKKKENHNVPVQLVSFSYDINNLKPKKNTPKPTPFIGGKKNLAIAAQKDVSWEEYPATEKKKQHKSLEHDMYSSDEIFEINSAEHITKGVITSSSKTRGGEKHMEIEQMSWSLEDEFTTKQKNPHKGSQGDMTTFANKNVEKNNEDITRSVSTSPSTTLGSQKQAVTDKMSSSLKEDAAVTKKKQHHKVSQQDNSITNENLEKHISKSVLASPTTKPAENIEISRGIEEYDVTTKTRKHHKHHSTTFSDENIEMNREVHITKSFQTVADQINWSLEDEVTTKQKKHHKDSKGDITTLPNKNVEISSEEHMTKSILTSPSHDSGSKKQGTTQLLSWNSDEDEDENLEIISDKYISERVLASPSTDRSFKTPEVTSPISKSVEEYDITTQKRIHHKDLLHIMKLLSGENLELKRDERFSESVLTSRAIDHGDKKQTATDNMSWSSEEDDTTTTKKYHNGLKHDLKTFSDEPNNHKRFTYSIITSPSIDRGVKEPAATSKIFISLESDDAGIKKKHEQHDMTTSSDEYSDQEDATEADFKSPSKIDDIKKSTTTGPTNVGFEEYAATLNKQRYKTPKKASKKIKEQFSDSRQEDYIEDGLINPIVKESQSLEMNFDTTTENVFNTMKPQYFQEDKIANISAHSIEEDPQIKYFIGHILRSALRIFSNVKNKTNSRNLAAKLDLLADKYVYRYNLYVDEIKKNKIRTSLGTQKVLLNAIESSDHMLNRILNYIIEDTRSSNKDILRTSINVANEFRQAIDKETKDKYTYVCRLMEICHAKSGFGNFLNEYISTILLCDNFKFGEAVKSFTEVTKRLNFIGTFGTAARLNIFRAMKYIESQDLKVQRILLMIIRNIVAYKNEPLKILKSDRAVNSTLAILEILEAFETKLVRSDANIIIWGDLLTNLNEWSQYKRNDIHDTMNNLMSYIKTALDEMPVFIKKRIARNIGVIMNRKIGM